MINATKGYGFVQPDGGGKDIFLTSRRSSAPDSTNSPTAKDHLRA